MRDELNSKQSGKFSETINHNVQTGNNLLSSFIPHPSSFKILLWDIDGTLMRSTVPGSYKKYFTSVMRKVYGNPGNLDEINPSGMTDTQIIYESLRGAGFSPEQIFARIPELLEVFETEMTAVLTENGEPFKILPGVRETLAETDRNPRFINALLTGNLSVAAEIKLSKVGLWHYFENVPNAFGEISHKRDELAVEAGKLFNEKYDFEFSPQQFIVIGDTPNDIACARAFGAKVVAVATGRGQLRESLIENKPDFLLEDFSDTKRVLQILENL